ncbi:MAG: PhzF family phenazine biosynthesis protein [Capsulimonadaceae bacterium]
MQLNNHRYRYRVVDVFTNRALEGNPLAVFLDARGLTGTTMQRLARELNLSETAFILPSTRPDCVARVRIFTPAAEMTFAGHPTLGSARVILDEGFVAAGTREFAIDEAIGAVPIRVDDDDPGLLWLSTPPISFGDTFALDRAALAVGLTAAELQPTAPQVVSAGNPTLFIAVRDQDAVDRCVYDRQPDFPPCVFVFTPTPDGAYSRMFAPALGVAEDPATGSSTGPLAAYMIRHGLAPSHDGARFVSLQGVRLARPSRLHIRLRGPDGVDAIHIGGHVAPFAECVVTAADGWHERG